MWAKNLGLRSKNFRASVVKRHLIRGSLKSTSPGVCVGKLGDLWTCLFFFLFFPGHFLNRFAMLWYHYLRRSVCSYSPKWCSQHQPGFFLHCVFLMFSWFSYLSYPGRVLLAAVFVVFLTPQVLEPVGLSCEWRFDLRSRYDPPIFDRKVLIKFWWDGWERLKQQVFCFWS